MKVGIMSMQRVVNYGSFLQAYALKRIIENNTGANVEFIDYRIGEILKESEKKKSILTKIKDNRTLGR